MATPKVNWLANAAAWPTKPVCAVVACSLLLTEAAIGQLATDSLGACTATALDAGAIHREPVLIQDGETVQWSQRAAERVSYEFSAVANGSYLVEVTQNGLDLVVTIEFPDGTQRSFDSPLRRDEREVVLIEPLETGTHRLVLSSNEHTHSAGTHRLALMAVNGQQDASTRTLYRLITAGAEANHAKGDDRWLQARAIYETITTLELAQAEPRWRAYGLFAAATLDYWHLDSMASSVEQARQAAQLYHELDEPVLAASAIHLQGAALIEMADESADPQAILLDALELFGTAARTQGQFGRNFERAHTLNNIGYTYYKMGDWPNAQAYWERAAPIFANLDETSGELLPLGNLGAIDLEKGNLTSALATYKRVLELQAPGKDLQNRVDFLANLATIQRILGDFDDALRSFSCSKEIADQIDYAWGEGWALAGIGETYFGIGEFDLAKDYLELSLPIEREAGDSGGQSVVLRHLGNLHRIEGDLDLALSMHQEAASIPTSPPLKALVELEVARDLSALARYDEAITLATDALAVADRTGSELLKGDAHRVIGRTHLDSGRFQDARDALTSALDIYTDFRMAAEQALTLHWLALTARSLGELDRAVEYGAASIEQVENIRGRVSDPELRSFYLSARREYYELQIALLLEFHAGDDERSGRYLAEALSVSERSKARLTLDLLERGAITSDELDAATRERRDNLYDALAEQRFLRDRLARAPGNSRDRAALNAVIEALASTENELILLDTELLQQRASSGSSRVLAVEEMQSALDPETVLIQYMLGSPGSFAWVITDESIEVAQLPDRATVTELSRRVFENLTSPQTSANRRATTEWQALADMILPDTQMLRGRERLVIAADGAIQYIPFGFLPAKTEDGPRQPLIETHEIVYVPSLSVIVNQRTGRRQFEHSKDIAVFADAVFDESDPRLPEVALARSVGDATSVSELSAPRQRIELGRLPMTAREAASILDLVPEERRYSATGFAANRDNVLSTDLSDYRIVHFATHGIVDTQYADLSALVFSRFEPTGQPRNGLLELRDIFGLDLNADLVVLSACETALGREVSAEGLLGFTQGFLHAGAKSQVVTLWPVSDRATAELMAAFYKHMIEDAMLPGDALRTAQRSIAAQRQWADPYFWAGFMLVGDWL